MMMSGDDQGTRARPHQVTGPQRNYPAYRRTGQQQGSQSCSIQSAQIPGLKVGGGKRIGQTLGWSDLSPFSPHNPLHHHLQNKALPLLRCHGPLLTRFSLSFARPEDPNLSYPVFPVEYPSSCCCGLFAWGVSLMCPVPEPC